MDFFFDHLHRLWRELRSKASLAREDLKNWRNAYILRRPFILLLILYSLIVTGFTAKGWLGRVHEHDPSHWVGKRVGLTGVVAGQPDLRPTGCVYVLATETIRALGEKGSARSVQGRVLLHVFGVSSSTASPGDRLEIFGPLQSPRPARIPGTFDYQDYLRHKGVHCVLYTGSRSVRNLGPSGFYGFRRWGWIISEKIVSSFNRHLTPEQAAVLAGLVAGRRPRFHPEIKRVFMESGTMHILVASGANAAFVIGLWCWIVKILLRWPRPFMLMSSIPPLWLYVLIAGCDAPIVRAAIMATSGVISYVLAREDRPYHSLAVAALSILIPSPHTLFDVGFQMSFITVFGLIYFTPRAEKWFSPNSFWLRWGGRLMAGTLSAQIWLFPITASVFKRFFPVSLLSNLLVLPLSALGFLAGLAMIGGDVIQHFIPSTAAAAGILISGVKRYLDLLIAVVTFFADHPGKSFWFSTPHWIWVAGYYTACFSVVGLRRRWICRIAFAMGMALVVGGHVLSGAQKKASSDLKITWLSVGRELSVLAQTKEGESVLINPGPIEPYNTIERTLMPYLAYQSINRLNGVVITKPIQPPAPNADFLRKMVRVDETVFCDKARRGKSEFAWGFLSIAVLPDSDPPFGPAPVLLSYKGLHVLIAHSLSLETQDALLRRGPKRLDVIQARFFGKSLWAPDFIERYKPGALVEVNPRNLGARSLSSWSSLPMVVPSKEGWWVWEGNGTVE